MAENRKKASPDRVAVLVTSTGPLVIRSNPTQADVKRFVKEHNRRHRADERESEGGGRGRPAELVTEAYYFDAESPVNEYDLSAGTRIDLPGADTKPKAPPKGADPTPK
jgi:hypothetical protein